jgi:hypothetical protein
MPANVRLSVRSRPGVRSPDFHASEFLLLAISIRRIASAYPGAFISALGSAFPAFVHNSRARPPKRTRRRRCQIVVVVSQNHFHRWISGLTMARRAPLYGASANRQHAVILSPRYKGISMRRGVSVSGTMACLIAAILLASSNERHDVGPLWLASDVWVEQARGNIVTGAPPPEDGKSVKAAPEGSSSSTANGGPAIPTTCNQQNASSPACYSATQQARPSK